MSSTPDAPPTGSAGAPEPRADHAADPTSPGHSGSSPRGPRLRIGCDIGGTFTDIVVELPDGSLHADLSPFIDVSTRPGRSRWLYDDQMQYLWALCGDLGFGDEARANGPANPDTLRPAVGERLAILTIRAGGRKPFRGLCGLDAASTRRNVHRSPPCLVV